MNSKAANFEPDESKGDLKNNINDEQPLESTDDLHEDGLKLIGGIFSQLFTSSRSESTSE